jgi:hypothetical protein
VPLRQHTHTLFHARNRQIKVASEVVAGSCWQYAKTHLGLAGFEQSTGHMAQGPVPSSCHDGRETPVQRLNYEPPLITWGAGLTKGKPREMLSKQGQVVLLNASAASPS